MGKFYLKTSEDTVPGVKLLKDYKKTSYELYGDTPHGFVEGQKIGLKANSVYKVTMYTDAGFEITSGEVVAQPFENSIGVYLDLDDGIILDGAEVVPVTDADGNIVTDTDGNTEYEVREVDGYWVPHNQYFLEIGYGSVYFIIEGCNGDTGEFLTREEIGYENLPLESLPKEIQRVFNPELNYSQEGFRADLTSAVRIGNLYYFNETLGICPGNEYQICLASPTNEWDPAPLMSASATYGNIPGTITLELGSASYSTRAKGDKSEKENKDTRVGLGMDRAYVDNYGNIQHGEGILLSADIFSYITPEYLQYALANAGVDWDSLTEEQQTQYLNATIAIFGEDVDGNPIMQKNIKTPTIQTNITGVARSIGGLKKSVEELNNIPGLSIAGGFYDDVDSDEGSKGEIFNDYSKDVCAYLAGPYSTRQGYKFPAGMKIVAAGYDEKPDPLPDIADAENRWKNMAQIKEDNNEILYTIKDFLLVTESGEPDDFYQIDETIKVNDLTFVIFTSEVPSGEFTLYPVHAALGTASHVEGAGNLGLGMASHTQGNLNTNKSHYGFVSGYLNYADEYTAVNLMGAGLEAHTDGQTIVGVYNDPSVGDALFAVGGGTDDDRANVLTVDMDGNLNIFGSLSNNGADYAEYYEWADGNPNNEDRTGHFVTFASGNKIRLAQPDDEYVLGVISATPTVVGNSHKEQWQGKYMRDVYGRILTETIEHEEEIVRSEQEEVVEIIPAYTEVKPILNPDYDPTKEYIGRDKRPEWSPVGTHGQLVVLDDGSCQVDAFCALGSNGMATAAAGATSYRVIERLDDTHVKVVLK